MNQKLKTHSCAPFHYENILPGFPGSDFFTVFSTFGDGLGDDCGDGFGDAFGDALLLLSSLTVKLFELFGEKNRCKDDCFPDDVLLSLLGGDLEGPSSSGDLTVADTGRLFLWRRKF